MPEWSKSFFEDLWLPKRRNREEEANFIRQALEMTPEIGKSLRNRASLEELKAIAVGQGMTTMAADGVRRAANGETTLDEIVRVIGLK